MQALLRHRPRIQETASRCRAKLTGHQFIAIRREVQQQSTIFPDKNQDGNSGTHSSCSRANNDLFRFSSVGTKVIPDGGWRFAPACYAAQSVSRRGHSCAVAHHRLPLAALNLHRCALTPRTMRFWHANEKLPVLCSRFHSHRSNKPGAA